VIDAIINFDVVKNTTAPDACQLGDHDDMKKKEEVSIKSGATQGIKWNEKAHYSNHSLVY
jgi:hypothetical protein